MRHGPGDADRPLNETVCLITGGALGIGWATGQLLAQSGARAYVLNQPSSKIDPAAAGTVDRGAADMISVIDTDVTDRASFERAIRTAHRERGRIDILINDAVAAWWQAGIGDTADRLRIGYDTMVYGTETVLPLMRAAGGGHIVNVVAGAATFLDRQEAAAYAATKAAIEAYGRRLSLDLRDSPIAVTLVRTRSVPATSTPGSDRPAVRRSRIADLLPDATAESIAESVIRRGLILHRSVVDDPIRLPWQRRRRLPTPAEARVPAMPGAPAREEGGVSPGTPDSSASERGGLAAAAVPAQPGQCSLEAGQSDTPQAVLVPPNLQTGSYVLTAADGGGAVEVSSSQPATVTVPAPSVADLPVGSTVEVLQRDDGQVSILPGAGVSLRSTGSGRLRTRYSPARLRLSAPSDWAMVGDWDHSVPAVTTSVIDFGTVIYTIDAVKSFGHCVSGYSGDGGDLRTSPVIQGFETALAPGLFRLGFKWDAANGRPVNGATGGVGLGDDWVAGINRVRPKAAAILGILEGDVVVNGITYPEMGVSPADAASIVHHYNDGGGQNGGPIGYWIVGNEPDLVGTARYDWLGRDTHDGRNYGDTWLQIYAAVKAADPTIRVGGPAAAQFSGHIQKTIDSATSPGAITQFWNDFLTATRTDVGRVADLVDFCNYHFYGTGTGNEPTDQVMTRITLPNTEIPALRGVVDAYSPGRGATLPVIVSEFNWAYRPNNGRPDLFDDYGLPMDGRFIMAVNTVWTAGYLLNILRGRGWGAQFADLVGSLGLYTRNADADNTVIGDNVHHYPHGKPFATPYAAYYGLGMWTGLGQFRRFGSDVVNPVGSVTNLQLFAASAGKNRGDVVIVNRDEAATRNLTITTVGIADGTSVDVWTTNRFAPWDPPAKSATLLVTGGAVTGLLVDPMTVVRLVIGA
jgi:NAD(P)-dependent dehydrogenase (short-subunit alcohol dehydrogenase family)